jgi:hypothetical protein
MQHKKFVACAAAAVMAVALGCSDDGPTPVSPTSAESSASGAGPQGETLKVNAPTPQSPVNNQQPDSLMLVAGKSNPSFGGGTPRDYSYEFEIRNSAGTNTVCPGVIVPGGSGSTVSATPTCTLEFEQPYTWRVRAVFAAAGAAGAVGPWSSNATFRAPAGGYIRGNEVYDPLINGKTIGEIVGPVTFIPGVGVRLETYNSHIRYRLPETLVNGEFSLIITGVATNTEGGKTKVFAMSEGLADLITNDRRMTVEKRGDPAGIVAWRFISHEDQVDTEGAEREFVAFDPNTAYLWTATWNGVFNVRIERGGTTIYSKGKSYQGAYDPSPHYAFIGAPEGRSGNVAATVPGMIVRQVWISPRARPAGLGQ